MFAKVTRGREWWVVKPRCSLVIIPGAEKIYICGEIEISTKFSSAHLSVDFLSYPTQFRLNFMRLGMNIKLISDVNAVFEDFRKKNVKGYIMAAFDVMLRGESPIKTFHLCTFARKRLKLGAKVYQPYVLEGVIKQLSNTCCVGTYWIFQQDSAAAHKSKTNQQWL